MKRLISVLLACGLVLGGMVVGGCQQQTPPPSEDTGMGQPEEGEAPPAEGTPEEPAEGASEETPAEGAEAE